MFPSFSKKIPKVLVISLSSIILAVVFSYGFYLVNAAWSDAISNPPTCPAGSPGCDPPLNVSSMGQYKAGGLILNTGGAAIGLIVQNGNVGIGTTGPSQKLSVEGYVSAYTPLASSPSSTVATKGYVDAQVGGGGGAATCKPKIAYLYAPPINPNFSVSGKGYLSGITFYFICTTGAGTDCMLFRNVDVNVDGNVQNLQGTYMTFRQQDYGGNYYNSGIIPVNVRFNSSLGATATFLKLGSASTYGGVTVYYCLE